MLKVNTSFLDTTTYLSIVECVNCTRRIKFLYINDIKISHCRMCKLYARNRVSLNRRYENFPWWNNTRLDPVDEFTSVSSWPVASIFTRGRYRASSSPRNGPRCVGGVIILISPWLGPNVASAHRATVETATVVAEGGRTGGNEGCGAPGRGGRIMHLRAGKNAIQRAHAGATGAREMHSRRVMVF